MRMLNKESICYYSIDGAEYNRFYYIVYNDKLYFIKSFITFQDKN